MEATIGTKATCSQLLDQVAASKNRPGLWREFRGAPQESAPESPGRFSGPGLFCFVGTECETHIGGPWDDWVRLKYEMTDYWTGEPLAIDDKIFLATSRPPFGGLRWWFVCPQLNRRVRKLYLPRSGRHFWSRRAYELAYASQRETKFDRALRRARKLRLRLAATRPMTSTPTSRRGCAGRRTIACWTSSERRMASPMND